MSLRAWLRARVRTNEFFLVFLAVALGVGTGFVVTLMSELAQHAHVLIYGIRIDVRLSANDVINPWVASASLVVGGFILGLMEWYRRRKKISAAVSGVRCSIDRCFVCL